MRRSPLVSFVALAAAALVALPPAAMADPRPSGLRPPADNTVEAGMWYESDKAETAAKNSAERDTDPELTAYVRTVACKVAPEYCQDIRVYLMDRPFFNAQMAPNGYMEVWSGALLRVTDEAELAFILGHESSHFSNNHSLQAYNTLKARQNAALALSIAITVAAGAAAAGANSVNAANNISYAAQGLSNVVYLGAVASFFAFNREQESEADRLGFERMVRAGYDPLAPVALWQSVLGETAASDFDRTRRSETSGSIFRSHPLTPERINDLRTLGQNRPTGENGRARYRAVIRPHLAEWLKDDLRRRDFGETLFVIGRLAADGEDLGVLKYYEGEAYRLRRADGDQALAIAAYETAVTHPDAPVAAWRELGNLYAKAGDRPKAAQALRAYLERAPAAQDRWLVEAALKKMEGEAQP